MLFRHRDFSLVWLGQSLSALGNFMFPVAIAALVLDAGGSASTLGVTLATCTIGLVVGAVGTAALGDRWGRARLMMVADTARLSALIGLVLMPSAPPVLALLALVFVLGAGEGIFEPAYAALMPRLVPPDLLQRANGVTICSLNIAMALGPALAGVLVTLWGPDVVLAIDALTFAFGLATLVPVADVPPTGGRPRDAGRSRDGVRIAANDLRDAARELTSRRWLLSLNGMVAVVMSLAVAPTLVLLPVIAQARLGGDRAYGVILAAIGVGSVIGSLIAGRLQTRRPGLLAVVAVWPNSMCMGTLVLLPLSGVLAVFMTASAGVAVYNVLIRTAIQRDLPGDMLARVLALDSLCVTATTPIGYALAGPVAAWLGTHAALLSMSALAFVASPLPLLVRGVTTLSSENRRPCCGFEAR